MIKGFRLGIIALAALMLTTTALADYTFVVPQKPGGGTSVWASIIAVELEKQLDERIVIRHIPGARDMTGFNEFHNELRFQEKVIMVSHGGNGVSFLQERVDYDYREYSAVGLMNLDIIVGIRSGVNPDTDIIKFAAGSGMVPEGLAIAMLRCGPVSEDASLACFKENVVWVRGMKGSERRLAFRRGELNGTRENPAAFKKHNGAAVKDGTVRVWMTHGVMDPKTGIHVDDKNYPGKQFEILYEKKWGQPPSGNIYDSYRMVKSWRDGIQKALWMNKDDPNLQTVRVALERMSQSPESIAAIQAKVGQYDWIIGENAEDHLENLFGMITDDSLATLVWWNVNAYGLSSVYKPGLIN